MIPKLDPDQVFNLQIVSMVLGVVLLVLVAGFFYSSCKRSK